MSSQPFEQLDASALAERYDELLKSAPKVEPDPLPTFLEISGFPHYEEVVSNWYAFFFTTDGPHGFGHLFINTLIELANKRTTTGALLPFERCQVIRERIVQEKRIDLLLYDEAKGDRENETYRNAIIIENKIFAGLYNDLDFYYDAITVEEVKLGIVLSITPHHHLPTTFVNITHKDFLNGVLSNLGKHLYGASDKYLLLLKDLIQQISFFNKTENMKEYVTFYFNNAGKINELASIREKAQNAFLDDLGTQLSPTPFTRRRRYPESVNIRCAYHPNVLLVLQFGKVFEDATYRIELWITYDLAKAYAQDPVMADAIRTETKPPADFSFRQEKSGPQYLWVGSQERTTDKSISDIQALPAIIATDLNDNWSPFILQILSIMHMYPAQQ